VRRFRLPGIRVTPALVISLIALFVALAGTGVAASVVPLAKRALVADRAKTANTAKTAKVANTAKTAKTANTAKTAKVANAAKTALIANTAKSANAANSAATAETANSATTAGDAQTLGGQSAAQIAAIPGPANSIPSGLLTFHSVGWSVNLKGDRTDVRALCGVGERVVGGGFDIASGIPVIMYNRPLDDGSGWWVRAYQAEEDTSPSNGSAWAICVKVS
jgi:hypothetical protein